MTNESDEHALSLHVYSPALTSMTFYEVVGDQLWSARWRGPTTAAASPKAHLGTGVTQESPGGSVAAAAR